MGLRGYLFHGSHVSHAAQAVASTLRNDVGAATILQQALGLTLHDGIAVAVVPQGYVDHFGAHQLIEKEIAVRDILRLAVKNKRGLEVQPSRRQGRGAAVIALKSAACENMVSTTFECFGHDVLEFPHFVAAEPTTGEVVALDVDGDSCICGSSLK